jgi:hypothetical protein
MVLYGYARVSSEGQTLDAQIAQLQAAGAEKVFREKGSGARGDRVQLRKAIATLTSGDVLLVTGSIVSPAPRETSSTFSLRSVTPPPHSITSSALARSVGGIVRPRAVAVRTLITSSNRVAW